MGIGTGQMNQGIKPAESLPGAINGVFHELGGERVALQHLQPIARIRCPTCHALRIELTAVNCDDCMARSQYRLGHAPSECSACSGDKHAPTCHTAPHPAPIVLTSIRSHDTGSDEWRPEVNALQ